MKRILLSLLLAAATSASPLHAATDGETEARRVALDLAGAFSNDGFKLRDGVWAGTLEPGKPRIVQVNLYAGNEYWFALGATGKAKKLAVTVYDETGKLVESEPYQEKATAAAGFSPDASGPYFVKIELAEGDAASFCLVYCYK
jgi:hypothetical protein